MARSDFVIVSVFSSKKAHSLIKKCSHPYKVCFKAAFLLSELPLAPPAGAHGPEEG